jgi:hypothetical protein
MHLPLAGIIMTLGALVLSFLFLPSALVVLWKETKSGNKLLLFISAFLSGVAFILGMLFKIQHWPGASLVISLGLLSCIFLLIPSLLYQLFMDKEKKYKRTLYVTGSISVMIYLTGFWFRLMHWPSANILILSGTFVLIFIVLPLFTRMQWKTEKQVNARFIFMIVAPLLFIIPGALVNLNLELNYEGGFYLRMQEQEALIDIQNTNNKYMLERFTGSTEFHDMEEIHMATENLLGTIRKIQNNMAAIPEGLAGTPDKSILEKEVSAYEDILNGFLGVEWTREFNLLFDVTSYLPSTVGNNSYIALAPAINRLSLLSSGIMLTESAALKQLSSMKKEN